MLHNCPGFAKVGGVDVLLNNGSVEVRLSPWSNYLLYIRPVIDSSQHGVIKGTIASFTSESRCLGLAMTTWSIFTPDIQIPMNNTDLQLL